jgi:hypothetical protein
MLLKCAQTTIEFHIVLNLHLQQLVSGKQTFYGSVLESVTSVALVRRTPAKSRLL